MADKVLAVPEKLAASGQKYSDKAKEILDLLTTLATAAQKVGSSLTPNAKASFEELWADYDKEVMGLAKAAESMSIIMANAAIGFLETDKNIAQALSKDPTAAKNIESEISSISSQKTTFESTFSQDLSAANKLDQAGQKDQPSGTNTDPSKSNPQPAPN